ncbi:MAG: ATP-binding cassette domain-containing protein [Candidatus Hydrothermarchaeaceae archaeon]
MKIIEIHDLSKEFNGLTAVDKINFSVEKGEIFGFLGPNGSGKTTTINMLATLLLPTGGSATVNGFDIVKESHEVRESVGIVPQEVVLENDLTARENLEFHGALYDVAKKDMEERIPDLLDLVELSDRADDRVITFSGGMKRRLEVVKAFLHTPTLIFMDEPTLGLDPQTRRVIWEQIQRLKKEENTTVFMTTHYMEEADYLCDRIAIIDYGKILDLDTPSNLKHKIGEGDIIDMRVSGDIDPFLEKLEKEGCSLKKREDNFIRLMVLRGEDILPKIVRLAEREGITIGSLSIHEPTLEDVFIHYTGREIREEKAESSITAVLKKFKGVK